MANNKNRNALNEENLENVSGGYTEEIVNSKGEVVGMTITDDSTGEYLATVLNEEAGSKSQSKKLAGLADMYHRANVMDKELNKENRNY